MKRTAILAAFTGVLALVVALMWVGSYQGTGVSAIDNPPVGTAGRHPTAEPDGSPATLHDLETVTGTIDPHELIDRRVDFHEQVAEIDDDTSFWVGTKDNRILVVLARGAPSPNDTKPATPGQMVHITGTIEGQDRKVYIRAEQVTPEG